MDKENKVIKMPPQNEEQAAPTPPEQPIESTNAQPSELEIRARNEMSMLEHTASK